MKVKNSILLFFTVLVICLDANSADGRKRKIYLDFGSSLGWGSASRSTDLQVPSIGSYDFNIGIGINLKKVTIGFSFDYRILTQFSDVTAEAGNRRGTFITPVSPFVGFENKDIRAHIMLINSGTYVLDNLTYDASGGKKVTYVKPSGLRFSLLYNKLKKLRPLLFYEKASFGGMELDGVSTVAPQYVNYTNYGVGFKYEF